MNRSFDQKPFAKPIPARVTIVFREVVRRNWVHFNERVHPEGVDPNHRASAHMAFMIHERPSSLIEDNPCSG